MPFTMSSLVVASDDQVSTAVGGEAVILGLRDGVYYGLDAVGFRVWTLLAEPVSVTALAAAVVAEFEVSPEQCERDLLALLADMEQRGLVRDAARESDEPVS
jgi:hypothetical protein